MSETVCAIELTASNNNDSLEENLVNAEQIEEYDTSIQRDDDYFINKMVNSKNLQRIIEHGHDVVEPATSLEQIREKHPNFGKKFAKIGA